MMLMIQNIHVFDPEYQGVKDVLITGNTIHKIADSLPVTAAYEMKVIDGTGKFLIPGLIDSHVHILGGGGEGGQRDTEVPGHEGIRPDPDFLPYLWQHLH